MSELEPEGTPEPSGGEPEGQPTEEAWSGVTQEQWEESQQTLAQANDALGYMYERLGPVIDGPQQAQAPQPMQIDPLDDNFQGQLDRYLEEKIAPYAEYVQAQQFREGEARAQDILSDIKARDGDFVFDGSTDKARMLANEYIGEMNQQYPGQLAKAAEAAIEAAAKDVRAWEQEVKNAAIEQYRNELAGLSGVPRQQPAAGSNGTQQFAIPSGGGLIDVAYRHGNGR
jgi:hypothetical protein